jgi:hypothetical protein
VTRNVTESNLCLSILNQISNFKNNTIMKELSIEQMELVSGGGPTGHQVACWAASVAYGFVAPPLGIIAGFVCLWA